MSIKLMSAIFETEFFDLPLPEPDKDGKERRAKGSSVKLVMLALADHANDEGEASYPGFTRLQLKTSLSRQGVTDVLSAIKHNGLAFVSDQPSKLGTNNYTINLSCFPRLDDKEDQRLLVKSLDQSSHLTSTSQATLPEVVKPLDLNHSLTTHEPHSGSPLSEKHIAEANKMVDAILEQTRAAAIRDEACKMFEKAFGFGRLPWDSKKDWERFTKFVAAEYAADRSAFGNYVVWRAGEGKYAAMSNKQIRTNPQVFMDTGWPEFLASKQLVHPLGLEIHT